MSYVPQAFATTLQHEGGYFNDPADRGLPRDLAQTSSRLAGWARIDALKGVMSRTALNRHIELGLAVGCELFSSGAKIRLNLLAVKHALSRELSGYSSARSARFRGVLVSWVN